jgi:tetratricopeptide (TPR) repeat protein
MIRISNPGYAFIKDHRELLICFFLIFATLAVFWQVQHFDFVNYDDNDYVTDNHHIQNGLTLKGVIWSFTTTHSGNWHPLTWLSHMIDYRIYGMRPGGHHLTNLFFHIANTLLLFFVFRKMTGELWQSSFVAALFALHPIHVESVAWISERKDVLSTFFFLLTIWCYFSWTKYSGNSYYLMALLFFILGLLAKPMLVTLPFVLLLLDAWPLCRMSLPHPYEHDLDDNKFQIFRFIWEKVPFFILAAASCIITFLAEKKGGAVKSLDLYPIKVRIANALLSYLKYLIKLFVPHNMAVLYEHPGVLPWWKITGALLILVSISFLAIRAIKQRPYFAVGWFWFLGTLIPVIGLVQVGSQAMADRYTYIPFIGLFIIIAWGAPGLIYRLPHKNKWVAVIATLFLAILTVTTWKQVQYWKNSITLFEHTLKVLPQSYLPHNNLGNALDKAGRTDEAIKHYREALRIKPDYAKAHNNLANALEKIGRTDEAIKHYSEALQIKPNLEQAHYNLANALEKIGRTDEAIKHYSEALQIKPHFEQAHNNLGLALIHKGNIAGAEYHFREALRINPDYIVAKDNLKKILTGKQEKR